jgi:hypothetical protein
MAISETNVVANQAVMLALSAQTGDVAVRTDVNKTYILQGTNPAVLGDWQEMLTPTDSVQSVDGRTGVVTLGDLYATAGHNHDGTYATSGHNHSGVYEPADATILKDADIGSTVAAQSHTHTKAQITDFSDGDYATAAQGTLAASAVQPGDNISTLTNNSGFITGYTVTQGDVTAHQAALTITESQISDLGSYLTDAPSNGSEYVRKDGAWAASAGGGASVDRQMASATAQVSTSSATWLDVSSMTVTTHDLGGTGTYLLTFSSEVSMSTKGSMGYFRFVVGGTAQTASETSFIPGRDGPDDSSHQTSFSMSWLVSGVANGTIIKVQWMRDANILYANNRRLIIDGTPDSSVV